MRGGLKGNIKRVTRVARVAVIMKHKPIRVIKLGLQ